MNKGKTLSYVFYGMVIFSTLIGCGDKKEGPKNVDPVNETDFVPPEDLVTVIDGNAIPDGVAKKLELPKKEGCTKVYGYNGLNRVYIDGKLQFLDGQMKISKTGNRNYKVTLILERSNYTSQGVKFVNYYLETAGTTKYDGALLVKGLGELSSDEDDESLRGMSLRFFGSEDGTPNEIVKKGFEPELMFFEEDERCEDN